MADQVQLSFGVQGAIVQGQLELSLEEVKSVSRLFYQQFFLAHKDTFLNWGILRESPQTFMSRFYPRLSLRGLEVASERSFLIVKP